ncbi:MAG: class IV adenylate cyclase [Thermomicrobiales bacterium]
MRNLELKVRCADKTDLGALVARARAGGATYIRTMEQRDIYFQSPRGRLKLREWRRLDGETPTAPEADALASADGAGEAAASGAVLIAYARPDESGSRFSDYILAPATDPVMLRAALDAAIGTRIVVEKRRQLYLWRHTRLHFDEVAGLGAFVELETVLDGADFTEAAEQEHRQVIALLGLAALPVEAGSYSDLIEVRRNGLRRTSD